MFKGLAEKLENAKQRFSNETFVPDGTVLYEEKGPDVDGHWKSTEVIVKDGKPVVYINGKPSDKHMWEKGRIIELGN